MNKIKDIYNILLANYNHQGWWPLTEKGKLHPEHKGKQPKTADQRFEIIVGAILTQNTSWTNVEKAIYNLNKSKSLSIDKIKKINAKKLGSLIRPAGYFNQKAKKLKLMAEFIKDNSDPDRESLLDVWGVGPETADSILLYAFNKHFFVIDAYTKRIFNRIGYKEKEYDDLQQLFMKNLEKSVPVFKEYHALIVNHGKYICTKSKPACVQCCLGNLCKAKDKFI